MTKRTFWTMSLLLAALAIAALGTGVSSTVGQSPPPRPGPEAGGPEAGEPQETPALDAKQESELLEALRQKLPAQYDRLVQLREDRPRAYRWALGNTWRWYQMWRDLPPDAQQAVIAERTEEIRIAQILNSLRQATSSADRDALKQQFAEAVSRHFDAEQKRLTHRLEELKAGIQRLEGELQRRSQDRQALIESRIDRYLSARPSELPPGPPGGPRGGPPGTMSRPSGPPGRGLGPPSPASRPER